MTKTVSKNRFLSLRSEMESVVFNSLFSMFRGLGQLLLRTLQAMCFTTLATYGAWPGLAYLVYMAVDS